MHLLKPIRYRITFNREKITGVKGPNGDSGSGSSIPVAQNIWTIGPNIKQKSTSIIPLISTDDQHRTAAHYIVSHYR